MIGMQPVQPLGFSKGYFNGFGFVPTVEADCREYVSETEFEEILREEMNKNEKAS